MLFFFQAAFLQMQIGLPIDNNRKSVKSYDVFVKIIILET
ncbi:hypothetical protein SAMN04488056_113123 [Cohaesibacter marisflavi]|uniref:Uncharacterized protein n=1 Tax=Cohaesibacter marisflavi TaxID=655353 RepID=A0A1I5KCT5_9HYPH|nr:hypothetical protein SAMN04488056_113123 [Cohaesibacter marisflavi]